GRHQRAAVGLEHPPHLPSPSDLRSLRRSVSSCQRRHAAAGRTEARTAGQKSRHQPDVGLHHRGPDRDGADGDAGRPPRRPLGPQALLPRRALDPARSRRALYAVGQPDLAEIVMVPMAMLVGRRADRWGHKRFFLAALLILPVRGALYTLSDNPAWLVGVQLLDGIGAGIFGAIFPVI